VFLSVAKISRRAFPALNFLLVKIFWSFSFFVVSLDFPALSFYGYLKHNFRHSINIKSIFVISPNFKNLIEQSQK